MASLFATVRVTTKGNAVWRTCAGCGVLAPLAPSEFQCRRCAARRRPAPARPTSERK